MIATRRFRLRPQQRLHGSRAFARVKAQGERRACGCLIANWVRLAEGECSRLGIVTSRRVGGAVQRSRARRLLREAFRLHQHQFRGALILILVARPSIVGKPLTAVSQDLRRCLREFGLWVETQSSREACASSL